MSKRFDKEVFIESVKSNLKTLYRQTLVDATKQQVFQAVSYAVKDTIIDNWMETQKVYEEEDPKMVYYMSMEFLMGRALGNNMINLTEYKEVKEALEELGFDLNVIEDQEPDAALGNGGLGRLAACFLDSLATLGYAAYGCGIRYRYGMFKQKIENGYQVEVPDNWLKDGNPFELRRPEYAKEVKFGGYIRVEYDEATKRNKFIQEGYQSVRAIPFDIPIVGYNNNVVNTLRVWDAEAINDFQLDSFDKGDYQKAVEQENLARNIVEVLYPNDNHYAGKELRLAKYIREHNGIDVDPRSIFDVQVKRLHEYKRQLLNILHVMYLYNKIKDHPEMPFYPRTFIFGAKAAAGYRRAKLTIKLINSVADVINNDKSINGKLKVVFIEDYRVSNAEWIFAAADVSEQISTASKEASGTGNMKFMLNGAPTLGTMDGANVEIVQEVGEENAFIFGLSAQEVINYENNGGYNPMDYFNNDQDIRRVLMQLINGEYAPDDPERFRDIYDSLLNTNSSDRADTYFILADFKSYAEAQERVEKAYRDETGWARMAMMNTACSGKFTSDRTIQQYVDEIWHLDKVTVEA